MNRQTRTLVVLAVAVAMAGLASFAVYRTVQSMPVRQVEVANYQVVVAAKSLGMGSLVKETDVKLVAWPTSNPVPNGHSDVKAVLNRGLLSAVVENEPLTESKLAPVEAGAGLQTTIPQGMRAMAVRVNEVVGVAGFVVPGTKVDVLVTIRRGDQSMTKTVTSNIQVLTAGQNVDQEQSRDGRPIPVSAVTLMVTPVDAERITLAQSQGELMLALRNPMDTATTETNGAAVGDLFGAPKPTAPQPVSDQKRQRPRQRTEPSAPPPPPAPERYIVESIKGGATKTEELKGQKKTEEPKPVIRKEGEEPKPVIRKEGTR
jgi:pilus assembly protein CpaB